MRSRQGFCTRPAGALLLAVALFTVSTIAAAGFRVELLSGGFNRPVFLTSPPGDSARLFVLEQHTGRIRIYDRTSGSILAEPFLTVSGITRGGEQGLLGLAFHPGYATNGFFYLNYTAPGGGAAGHTEIARYQAAGDPAESSLADPESKQVLLTIPQPESNHNAGWMAFGLDGFLYIATGDGGSGNDPFGSIGNAQDRSSLLGKILRIDVDNGDPYAIPESNPFTGNLVYRGEIWAFGLRNPWRCSFDRETGDLWIGDVGQSAREEIDIIPNAEPGLNFGWRPREGDIQNPAYPSETPVTAATNPVFAYGRSFGYSVTGGYVYRGSQIPDLEGKYIFADYGSGRFWITSREGEEFVTTQSTAEFNSPKVIGNPSSFGEDSAGELYICDYSDGQVFAILPELPPAAQIASTAITEGNDFVFTFDAAAGFSYLVESTSSLFGGTWEPVTNVPPAAADGPISITAEIDATAEFFRIRTEQP